MHYLKYQINNIAPLVISTTYGDMNMVVTEKYIPGTSVLGILVKQYLKKKNINEIAHEDSDFYNWFLVGNLVITNAYILSIDRYNKSYIHYPAPLSIQKEKTCDNTIDLLLTEADDAQRKNIDAFCFLDDELLQIKHVEKMLNFHHARDREKGISKNELIFNYEAIGTNQFFEGRIYGDKKNLDKLIECCGHKWTAYIGRSRNAQYGEVVFEILEKKPQPYKIVIKNKNETSLTFLSNTIIFNEFGYSTTDKENLEKYLGVKIKKAFIKKGQVENFVSVWRLKKPSETCFLAGSTFLLDISDIDDKKLEEFQKNGIGERTHEGFGLCKIGWQTKKELELHDESQIDSFNSPSIPQKPIPEITHNVLVALVKQYIIRQIELIAMDEQQNFYPSYKKLTGSLLGKLDAMSKNNNYKEFSEKLFLLRTLAKNKLERCNNGKENLFKFLMTKDITVNDISRLPISTNIKKLCNEINYTPENDDNFINSLYSTYMQTFFSMMRKNIKTKV